MKRILKFTTVLAFMFVTTTSVANKAELKLLNNSTTKSLVFELDSQTKETMIKFTDVNNNIIYSEHIHNIMYVKRFDLKNLNEGLYYFKAEDAIKDIIYTIRIIDDSVKIIEERENIKPFFRRKEDMVYLNLLNLTKEDVTVSVFDSNNRMIYSKTYKDSMSIEKAFNFTTAYKDNYLVKVDNTNGIYYKYVIVE